MKVHQQSVAGATKDHESGISESRLQTKTLQRNSDLTFQIDWLNI